MKTRNFRKKLPFTKQTIAHLDIGTMKKVHGRINKPDPTNTCYVDCTLFTCDGATCETGLPSYPGLCCPDC